ncbi:substrate-binding periplasmic protein [Undibacterium sp. SXout11W]|uniref:substrate-binding periplasmic protein n=1 Tax=Undibacterium sp. SXout11W TaxID=3413050 RepID=UPI003BF040E3
MKRTCRNIRRNLIFLSFIFIFITGSDQTLGAELRIDTIAVTPFGFLTADSKSTGMMYEIANKIAEQAGLHYTNTVVPYARTIIDIQSGNTDIVLRIGNDKLGEVAIPVATVVSMPIIIISRNKKHFNNLSEMHGLTVGVLRGGQFDNDFDNNSNIIKYAVNDYVQIIKMLVAGRLDAGIGTSAGIYYSSLQAGITPDKLGQSLLIGRRDFVLYMSKKTANPQTIEALRQATLKLSANGEIKNIIDKYMSDFNWDLQDVPLKAR